MKFSVANSERVTAIISTAVAILILAGGVTAYQSHTAPVDDIVQLESDLRFQLEIAFRHDPNERAKRLVELSKVSQAWQNSPRSTADREKLATWLLEVTIRSMPGSIETLPAVPTFGEATRGTEPAQPLEEKRPDILGEPPASIPLRTEPVALVPTPTTLASIEILQTNTEDLLANAEVEGVEFSVQASVTPFAEPFAEPFATTQPTPQSTAIAKVETVVPIRINMTELAARIAGYHTGLNEIEMKLLTLEADDYVALAKQVRQLDEMTRDFHFVRLYYEALTDNERRSITAPRPMMETLAEIERRLDRAQAGLSDDFLDEFDSSNQDRIGKLRQLLAEVSARVAR